MLSFLILRRLLSELLPCTWKTKSCSGEVFQLICMYFGGSSLVFTKSLFVGSFSHQSCTLALLLYIARTQSPCCAENKSLQTHQGVVSELWFGSIAPRAHQGYVSCAQPTWSLCSCRMAECLSGRVMMPLETPGRQSCCTSSMMLSGTWAGPSLPISLQCLEETTKWVLLPWLLPLCLLFPEKLRWHCCHVFNTRLS